MFDFYHTMKMKGIMGKLKNYLGKVTLTMFLGLFALLFNANAQQLSGDTFAQAKKNGSGVIVFTYVETPGFIYKDNTGRLSGVCIDILNDFVKYVNETYNIELKTKLAGNGSSFRAMYDGAKTGKGGVFGLGNVTITEVRLKEVKFSPPFIKNFSVLVSHSSVPTLKTFDDFGKGFNGMTAYTGRGTLNEKRILELKEKYYPELKVVQMASSTEVFTKLLADKKSFSYLDLAFYLDAIKKRHPLKRHEIGDTKSEGFGIAMPFTSDWAPIMEEFFNKDGGYTNSDEYKKILINHLGVNAIRLIEAAKQ